METIINNMHIEFRKNKNVYQLYFNRGVIPTLDMEWDGEKWAYVQKDVPQMLKDIERDISDYIETAAKQDNNEVTTKPDKGVWADIIKASVQGNPKPKKHSDNNAVDVSEILDKIEAAVNTVAPDYSKYLLYQVGDKRLHYSFNYSCSTEKVQIMENALLEIAAEYGLSITKGRMPE